MAHDSGGGTGKAMTDSGGEGDGEDGKKREGAGGGPGTGSTSPGHKGEFHILFNLLVDKSTINLARSIWSTTINSS